MDILQLKYFCDAAESENFSKTAEKFKVPTSNISQVIRRLEADLSCPLFDRNGNRVRLNANGRAYYTYAKTALEALEEGRKLLAETQDELNGELRVFVGCNRATVAQAIERFRADYPNVSFSLDHRLSDSAEYDLIISDRVEKRGYERRLLIREKMLVAVRADHPLTARKRIDFSELSDTRFLTMHEESSLSKSFHKTCKEAGFEPCVVIRCDDPSCLRRYVEMGLGALFFPSYSWRGLFSDKVSFLEPRASIFRDTYVFVRNDKTPSRSAELFSDCLEKNFAEVGEA